VDPVERLVAHEEIRQLAYRYALFTDRRDLDALVALFVSDVRVGRDAVGREALKANLAAQLREVGVTILHVTNHVIDLLDDHRASGVVYCRGEIQVGDQWVVQNICYEDDYRREQGDWRFVRRRHLLWYGADVLTRPLGLPPANWPASPTGQGELPERWPTWQAFWGGSPPPR
jgi:hypothetical protein